MWIREREIIATYRFTANAGYYVCIGCHFRLASEYSEWRSSACGETVEAAKKFR